MKEKYIPPKQLAEITFNSDKFYKLNEFLKKTQNEQIQIDPTSDYDLLGVRSYGLGVFKKRLKGYELSKGMSYYKAKPNYLFWCKVDTKNGAFGVIPDTFDNCIFTSNMTMLEIDQKKFIPYFIEILFRNVRVQEYFDNYISGSTNRKYVKTNELLEFYLPNIEIEHQQKIVNLIKEKEKEIIDRNNLICEIIEKII